MAVHHIVRWDRTNNSEKFSLTPGTIFLLAWLMTAQISNLLRCLMPRLHYFDYLSKQPCPLHVLTILEVNRRRFPVYWIHYVSWVSLANEVL